MCLSICSFVCPCFQLPIYPSVWLLARASSGDDMSQIDIHNPNTCQCGSDDNPATDWYRFTYSKSTCSLIIIFHFYCISAWSCYGLRALIFLQQLTKKKLIIHLSPMQAISTSPGMTFKIAGIIFQGVGLVCLFQ